MPTLHCMQCNGTVGCSNLSALEVNFHKVIRMMIYLPISHISQSFLDIVSNAFIRGTSSDTPFHTHPSPQNSRDITNLSYNKCCAFSAWLSLGCKQKLFAFAASATTICQPGCNSSASLHYVRAAATFELSSCEDCHFEISSCEDCHFGCNNPQSSAPCQLSYTLSPLPWNLPVKLRSVSSSKNCLVSCILSHSVAQLYVTVFTVSLGSCAAGAGVKCSDDAAVTIAGSGVRAVPGHCSCKVQHV